MKLFTGAFGDIVSVENLLEAWKEFVRGKRGKRDVQEFSLRLMDNIHILALSAMGTAGNCGRKFFDQTLIILYYMKNARGAVFIF